MRVGLVGCVKTKKDRSAVAGELYTSPLFRGRRAAVEHTCDRWYVLSALHGLVPPDQVLEPYDLALADLSRAERRVWSEAVLAALADHLGGLRDHTFEIHAGAAYTDHGLVAGLQASGATVEQPVAGLSLGQQLAWYRRSFAPGSGRERAPVAVGGGKSHRGSRYGPLRAYLAGRAEATLTVSFEEIEQVLGAALPASARRHRAWWSNGGQAQADAWPAAGYEVDTVDRDAGWVRFRRTR